MINEFLERQDTLITLSRYITEALILYILFKYGYRTRGSTIHLDDKTKERLIKDFKPEDIVDEKYPLKNLTDIPAFHRVKDNILIENNRNMLEIKYECADYDIFNLRYKNKKEVIEIIKNYGVGTCGPPGFYGTLDIHLELEKVIAEYLGVQSSILYSNNFTCINSVITCFCKHYDIVFYNVNCNEAIIRAIDITKGSSIKWKDLDELEVKIKKFYDKSKRNFIITEGLFKNTGEITDMVRLINIKNKYKLRLILDESMSIPMLGKKGISDLYKTDIHEIDVVVGSLAHVFCSNGGFAAGDTFTTDFQRLSAQSYCFSASMPGFLAKNSMCNLSLDLNIEKCMETTRYFYENFESKSYKIVSDENSPMIIITSKKFVEKNEVDVDEMEVEMVKARRIKRNLEKDQIRIGIIENPFPSYRLCFKENFKQNDIIEILKKIKKYLK